MSFETFIALRYLRSKKVTRFLSFLSVISLVGIFISVFSFVVIHSVMNGFSVHLREALVGFDAHMTIIPSPLPLPPKGGGIKGEGVSVENWLREQKEVATVTPVIEFSGIVQTEYGVAGGAKIRGVNPADLAEEPNLEVFFFGDEKYSGLEESGEYPPGLLIGEELYARLRFLPGDEEMVTILYPFGDVGPSGEIEPRRRSFRVLGVFSSGFYDYDTQYAFIDLKEASLLVSQGDKPTRILARMTDIRLTPPLREKLLHAFPKTFVTTWEEQNQRLFAALKFERAGMILLLSIVTFIASFNVFGLMTLLAFTKTRDMALFYALGLDRGKMQAVYRRLGVFLGLLGTALGLLGGLILVGWLKAYPLPLPPAYYLATLPAKVDWRLLVIVMGMSPFFSMLAAWGPAWQASKLNPMEILRAT
ncbi:MAG: ABC transporter permease [Deltaproteobacteria bacterium]|nr:ABC transporter permease [Deltaproteobacteria bacterium]